MSSEDPESSASRKPSQPTNQAQDRPSFWTNPISGVARDDKRSWFSTARKSEDTPAESTNNSVEEPVSTTGRDKSTDTNRLAQFIKSFLEDGKNRFQPQSKYVEGPHFDEQGTPIPPPVPLPDTERDSDLLSILSTPSICPVSLPDKGKGKEPPKSGNEFQPAALWNVLDRSKSDDLSDTSSVMIYSPIIPTLDSLVEVAETITETVEPVVTPEPETGASAAQQTWKEWFNPFKKVSATKEPPPPPKRQWVPSATQLTMQVMWWGYRIYLPPAVLELLSNKQLEATKRATIITTALQWLLGNIPLAAIPPPLQPIVFLVQQLVPLVGYVGAFIAWSWSGVKSFDKGNGVTLTATWILPVALIPGTWEGSLTNKADTEASDTASLLVATPGRLSIQEAEQAFSLPPAKSATSASTPRQASRPATRPSPEPSTYLPSPVPSSVLISPASSSSLMSPLHLSPHLRNLRPQHSSRTVPRTMPRKFGPESTPTSPPPVPPKDHSHSSRRRLHGSHRSATIPSGNALGLYTPASPARSHSIRASSTPRIKSPLSTSSVISESGESSRHKKVKHTCCASCTAAQADRAVTKTPKIHSQT